MRRPRKLRRTKKTAKHLDQHVLRRGWERYGVVFDTATRAEAVRQIQQKEGTFIERQSTNRTVWWVTIEGREIPVVYDKKRSAVVTVLHPRDSRCHAQLATEGS